MVILKAAIHGVEAVNRSSNIGSHLALVSRICDRNVHLTSRIGLDHDLCSRENRVDSLALDPIAMEKWNQSLDHDTVVRICSQGGVIELLKLILLEQK